MEKGRQKPNVDALREIGRWGSRDDDSPFFQKNYEDLSGTIIIMRYAVKKRLFNGKYLIAWWEE